MDAARFAARDSNMRVLLISANTERFIMPTLPLGLGLVAGAARAAGHDVSFLDLLGADDPVAAVHAAIGAGAVDVIGISIRNIDDQEISRPRFLLEKAREVVRACRDAARCPVVVGGAGYSIFPEAALRYLGADYGIRGEGEAAFPELLSCLAEGKKPMGVPGVVAAGTAGGTPPEPWAGWKSSPAAAVETASSADPSDSDLWIPVQSRRGCPLDCSYCSTAAIEGRRIRRRDPTLAAEEVAAWADRGFRRFHVVDSTFNFPRAYAMALCSRLRERAPGITWRAIVYPHRVDGEMAEAMAGSGCREVSLGFESGCDRVLAGFNKRFGREEIRTVSETLRARGIACRGFLLLGGPDETRDSVAESLDFIESLDLESLKIQIGIRIYPGTALAIRAREEGVIGPEDELLYPQFYLKKDIEDWTRRSLEERGLEVRI